MWIHTSNLHVGWRQQNAEEGDECRAGEAQDQLRLQNQPEGP
jgi:hypothetical protein